MDELPNKVCSYSKYSRRGNCRNDQHRWEQQHGQRMAREGIARGRAIRQRQPERHGVIPAEWQRGVPERG